MMKNPTVPFTVILCLLQAHPAAADICGDLAAQVRKGAGSTIELLSKYPSSGIRAGEEVRPVPASIIPHDFENPSAYPLGDSGALLLVDTQGTAYCQTPAFFDRKGGKFISGALPPGWEAEEGEYCGGDYLLTATVNSVPALIEEDQKGVNMTWRAIGWQNHRWGQTCTVNATFEPAFRVDESYGHADALAGQALSLARLYRDRSLPVPGSKADRDAIRLGQNLPDAKELPMFGKQSTNPYTTFVDAVFTPVHVGGVTYLAEVGGGTFGWRDYDGYLVAFWRLRSGALIPEAGYQIDLEKGKPRKVTTRAN